MKSEVELINDIFFDQALYTGQIDEAVYDEIHIYIETLEAVARVSNHCFYVVDYYKRNFLYVSPGNSLLHGLSSDEFREKRFLFFKEFTSPEDFKFILRANQEYFNFFYNLPQGERLRYTMSYDFNLMINKKKMLLNHKATPVKLNDNNEVWLMLCTIALAPKNENQEIEINIDKSESSLRLVYNTISQKWIEMPTVKLTEKEILILRLSMQGLLNPEIAEYMYLDVNTIKFHKKNIFSKLKVTNIQEAISFALNSKLI